MKHRRTHGRRHKAKVLTPSTDLTANTNTMIETVPRPLVPSVSIRPGTTTIVFIHRGNDPYLWCALQQAKRSNPHSDVILIGDAANQPYAIEGIQHVQMDDYMGGAQQFAHIYKHQSPNAYDYDLFCFQRWFILKDFMTSNHIERTCCMDSDMMVYAEVNNPLYHHFTNAWMMLSFNTLKTIEDLCYLMTMYFKNPDLYQYLQAYVVNRGHSGISDMVFADLFLDHCPQFSHNRNGIFPDGVFDGNIAHPITLEDGTLEMIDGKRKVYRVHGRLYARTEFGRMVPIHALHFQGDWKTYIPEFLAPDVHAASEVISYFDYTSRRWLPCHV